MKLSIALVCTGARCGIHDVHILVRCGSLHRCSTNFSAETLIRWPAGTAVVYALAINSQTAIPHPSYLPFK